MSIRNRIGSLERILAESNPSDCPKCGGPIPGQNGWEVVDDYESGRLCWGRCSTCGLALDPHGKPLSAYRLSSAQHRHRPMQILKWMWESV